MGAPGSAFDPKDPAASTRAAVLAMLDRSRAGYPFREIVTLTVKPAAKDGFRALTQAFVQATRSALGERLLAIEVGESVNVDCASQFLLTDLYSDGDAVRTQWQSDRLRDYQAAQLDSLAGIPDLRFYQTTD
jgi:quinol monooxygenase YgiN